MLKDFHFYTQQELDDLLALQDEFIKMTDTPANYTGQAGKTVIVNGGETALIFAAAGGAKIGATAFDSYATVSTFNTGFPDDDTVPQRAAEGDQILSSGAFTPLNASSIIMILYHVTIRYSSKFAIAVLFISTASNALHVVATGEEGYGGRKENVTALYRESAVSTAARTYTVKVGDETGTNCIVNDIQPGGASKFGASEECFLAVLEVLP